jgi:hypothetical protein
MPCSDSAGSDACVMMQKLSRAGFWSQWALPRHVVCGLMAFCVFPRLPLRSGPRVLHTVWAGISVADRSEPGFASSGLSKAFWGGSRAFYRHCCTGSFEMCTAFVPVNGAHVAAGPGPVLGACSCRSWACQGHPCSCRSWACQGHTCSCRSWACHGRRCLLVLPDQGCYCRTFCQCTTRGGPRHPTARNTTAGPNMSWACHGRM